MSYASPAPQPVRHQTDERFTRTGIVADAQHAAKTRAEFGQWLAQHLRLDAIRLSDLLLATYEALANAAEYAYLGSPDSGTMDLVGQYDPRLDRLVVTVDDRGIWYQRVPSTDEVASRLRGRGLPLMRVLADEATICSTGAGTQVRLAWDRVTVIR
jgi:serine/threonine-protein kinase RsbW